jgi:hypothetical protein
MSHYAELFDQFGPDRPYFTDPEPSKNYTVNGLSHEILKHGP